jgi:hypothetical protein
VEIEFGVWAGELELACGVVDFCDWNAESGNWTDADAKTVFRVGWVGIAGESFPSGGGENAAA